MDQLPALLARSYRPATTREIRSWSFGQVKSARTKQPAGVQDQRATLNDQAIFGPTRLHECACGKYAGPQHQGMICDRCGVKVTSPSVRRERFGHIDLGQELRHPLGEASDLISGFPVLPAVFVESSAGQRLADLYEALVRAVDSSSFQEAAGSLGQLVAIVLPLVIMAQEWGLADEYTLARGIAVEARAAGPAHLT